MRAGDKSIPFTDPLILAIQKDLKTVTRRPFKLGKAWIRALVDIKPDHLEGMTPPSVFKTRPILKGQIAAARIGSAGAVFAMTKDTQGACWLGAKPGEFEWVSPWGAVGDTMWVREHHRFDTAHSCGEGGCECEGVQVTYRADGVTEVVEPTDPDWGFAGGWRPPMFLPRWASRTNLRLLDVRVERLQDITEADAAAEGITVGGLANTVPSHRAYFKRTWEAIYGDGSWDANDWTWRLQFERVK